MVKDRAGQTPKTLYVYAKFTKMKRIAIVAVILSFCATAAAQRPQPVTDYGLPDSVKATALIASVQVPQGMGSQKAVAGIAANGISVYLKAGKKRCRVYFALPLKTGLYEPMVKGMDITGGHRDMAFDFAQNATGHYQLLLASAGDSAENFTLYSAYIFFPAIQKWKLIATYKALNQWTTLKGVSSFATKAPNGQLSISLNNVWCQRSNGSWKPLSLTDAPPPVLPPFSSIDSVRQFALDSVRLQKDMAAGKTDVRYLKEGVYYAMMKEGNGKQVALTDTVSVFYKGYLYADGQVFDQTKEKPARFPLARLIKGWQIGLPLCRVGGKIKLVILSGQAYAIRTRAAKIPPNSILVFEVEVVGAVER
jgi:FKBP-type peptidyl-prolyl cis-trans isomerase FkpA